MRKVCFRVRADVHLHLLPGALFVANLLASRANGKQAAEQFHACERLLQFSNQTLFVSRCLFQRSHIGGSTGNTDNRSERVAKGLDGEVEMMLLSQEGYRCFRSRSESALQDTSLDSRQARALFSADDFGVGMAKIVLFRPH